MVEFNEAEKWDVKDHEIDAVFRRIEEEVIDGIAWKRLSERNFIGEINPGIWFQNHLSGFLTKKHEKRMRKVRICNPAFDIIKVLEIHIQHSLGHGGNDSNLLIIALWQKPVQFFSAFRARIQKRV